MMFNLVLLIFCLFGSLAARQVNIDLNRLRLIPNETQHFFSSPYVHGRRSIHFDQIRRSNDYDDSSSGLSQPLTSMHILYPSSTSYSKDAIKIHKPREDPKLYYQSEAYLKEVSLKNVNPEVAAVYPGREVVKADEYEYPRVSLRKSRKEENRIYTEQNTCIRCPNDRTLVTKVGSDRVVLQWPKLLTCSGYRAPSNIGLVHMYGPKFGSLITRGSHTIISRITYKGETLHLCKIQVNVIVQSCPVPKYLKVHCNEHDRKCNFTCKDWRLQLQGEPSSVCGDNLTWENELPVCRARNWCFSPLPPEYGHMRCKGNSIADGAGLAEGSKCRIRCVQGWRPSPRGVTVCRRGVWTQNLQCQSKNRSPKV